MAISPSRRENRRVEKGRKPSIMGDFPKNRMKEIWGKQGCREGMFLTKISIEGRKRDSPSIYKKDLLCFVDLFYLSQ
jgi:hypothetical protein